MEYDVIIIGAGPAGYVAAIRAGQLGLKTVVVEKSKMGGMCLNWGCIPTKTIIESAKLYSKTKELDDFGIEGIEVSKLVFNWKKVKTRSTQITRKLSAGVAYLLKKNGVEVINGEAILAADGSVVVDNRSLTAPQVIIATGSYPAKISENLSIAPVLELDKLFDLDEIPENIVVSGRGINAVEMAQFFRLLGKTVTILSEEEPFLPQMDHYLQSFMLKKLNALGITVIIGEKAQKFEEGSIQVNDKMIHCDLLLNCSFRKAIVPKSELKPDLDEEGFIKTDDHFETSRKGVYAIGDVNGKSFVAHVASAEGIYVINRIKGITAEFHQHLFPINLYTTPEISQIGMTEQQIKAEGMDYKVSEFPLTANGKAMIEGNTEGFVRMLSEKKFGQVLGVQIVADHATDMIAEAAAYMQIEGTIYDVAQTIHAHPTVSEIFMEAGFDAVDKAIHK